MKRKYIYAAVAASMLSMSSCSGFLDTKPDTLLTQDQTFGDPVLVKSVLANFYGRITFGQRIDDWGAWTMLDEVINYDFNSDESINRNRWRPYDYTLIHDLNQFLTAIQPSTAVDDATKKAYMGEVKFIRAWVYFCMGRTLGGVPIVEDRVFDYEPGMDITALQVARSSEEELYNYVISECEEAANMLSKDTNKNCARQLLGGKDAASTCCFDCRLFGHIQHSRSSSATTHKRW